MNIIVIAIIVEFVFIVMFISTVINLIKNVFQERIVAVLILILALSMIGFGFCVLRHKIPETQHPFQYLHQISLVDEAVNSTNTPDSLNDKAGIPNFTENP